MQKPEDMVFKGVGGAIGIILGVIWVALRGAIKLINFTGLWPLLIMSMAYSENPTPGITTVTALYSLELSFCGFLDGKKSLPVRKTERIKQDG